MSGTSRMSSPEAEPKAPEPANTGRFGPQLWSYKDKIGTYDEVGHEFQKDRADYWHRKYLETTE